LGKRLFLAVREPDITPTAPMMHLEPRDLFPIGSEEPAMENIQRVDGMIPTNLWHLGYPNFHTTEKQTILEPGRVKLQIKVSRLIVDSQKQDRTTRDRDRDEPMRFGHTSFPRLLGTGHMKPVRRQSALPVKRKQGFALTDSALKNIYQSICILFAAL
jgi:hypothetical protein